jgi:site-specific recombinase XerD
MAAFRSKKSATFSFSTSAVTRGVPTDEVQAILGHASLRTT